MQGKPLTVTWYTQPQLPESLGWPVASPWTSRRVYTASSSDIFTSCCICTSYALGNYYRKSVTPFASLETKNIAQLRFTTVTSIISTCYYLRVDVMSLACTALCELYILMQSQIPDRFHTGNTPLLLLALSELPPGPQELQVGLQGKTPYTMAHLIWSKEELEGVEITHTLPKTWVDKVKGTFLHCKIGIS